jgi:ATP-dependent protease ClpP protease subunit
MAKRTYHLHLKGYVGGWNFDSDYVDYVLNKYKDDEVHVLINSLGGSVATALSVSAAFKRHGNVHVHYEGMNASAATIASLGAKSVTIDRNAMYLVHKCSQFMLVWDQMNADQLDQFIQECEKTKKDLDKIDLNIAGGYAARCKKEKAELLDLMREGGWLTAEEALDWGFVDEVTDLPEDKKPVMTEEVKDFMASEGIPMPNLPMDDDDERGLFSRFKEFLRGIYTTKETTNQVLSTMKKKLFSVIAAILALETFECEEGGSASLTDEQLATLENHINGLQGQVDEAHAQLVQRDTDIEGLKAQIAAKDAEIAELSKQPAASTQQVNNQNQAPAEPSQLQDYCAEVTGAQKMLDELNK